MISLSFVENAIKRISKKAEDPIEKEARLRLDVYKWRCMGDSEEKILQKLLEIEKGNKI